MRTHEQLLTAAEQESCRTEDAERDGGGLGNDGEDEALQTDEVSRNARATTEGDGHWSGFTVDERAIIGGTIPSAHDDRGGATDINARDDDRNALAHEASRGRRRRAEGSDIADSGSGCTVDQEELGLHTSFGSSACAARQRDRSADVSGSNPVIEVDLPLAVGRSRDEHSGDGDE